MRNHLADIEPPVRASDSVSGTDLNRRVWAAAAQKIVDGTLDTVFIECSYPVRLLLSHLACLPLLHRLDPYRFRFHVCVELSHG